MVKTYGDTTQMCADVFSGFIEKRAKDRDRDFYKGVLSLFSY